MRRPRTTQDLPGPEADSPPAPFRENDEADRETARALSKGLTSPGLPPGAAPFRLAGARVAPFVALLLLNLAACSGGSESVGNRPPDPTLSASSPSSAVRCGGSR